MPRLSALIPTQFARACATDGFIESCKQPLRELIAAPDGAAAASILAGAAGGPAAFIVAYAGVSLVQWKLGRRDKREVAERFERMQESLDRIEKVLRDDRERKEIERELDALFESDAGFHERFQGVQVQSGDEARDAVAEAVCETFKELDIEESFDDVRIYLSNLSDWVLEVRDDVRETRDLVRDFHDGPERLATADDVRRIIEETLDRKLGPSPGQDSGPPEVDQTTREMAVRLEHSAEASLLDRVNAAILTRDPEAERLLDELDRLTELADYTRHQRRGDYHYFRGEFDAAIDPYEKALELRPDDVTARNNAALAHTFARLGSIEVHRRRAIEIHLGTLERVPHGSADWAGTQNNLGNAYEGLPTGDRAANLAKAIGAYEAALTVRTRESHPSDWATTQNNLGVAYRNLPTGDRAANLAEAIEAYESALTVRTREAHPAEWAGTQNNLGIAYADLPTGDRAANLAEAIEAYESALTVYTREAYPAEWATTQNNLGVALADLADVPGQDRCDLLRRAISASKGALTVWTREAFPHDHAGTTRNLAIFRKAYESAGGAPPFDDIPPAE